MPRPRVSTGVLILVGALVVVAIALVAYLQEDSFLREWIHRATDSWRATRPVDRALDRLLSR